MRIKHGLSILLIAFVVWFVGFAVCAPAGAQPLTHVVVKGDTLWDICYKYYGDEELWPKLWQMNPFISNPHLLKPGDVIKLLEDVPMKETPIVESESVVPKETPTEFTYGQTGVDVSGFTNVASIGFLSTKPVDPWGHVVGTGGERVVFSEGDKVYVTMKRGDDVRQGDQFTVYSASTLQKHPLTGNALGYVITFLGRIAIKEKVKEIESKDGKMKGVGQEKYLFSAEILESYKSIPTGSPILSYEPVSPCVKPMPMERELTTNIVAVKELRQMIGQFRVVYLEHGYNHGVRRGNLFEVMEKRQVESPQKITLPNTIMGHVIVLEARPDAATGVVVTNKEEFSNGVVLSCIDWPNAKTVLSKVPECPLK